MKFLLTKSQDHGYIVRGQPLESKKTNNKKKPKQKTKIEAMEALGLVPKENQRPLSFSKPKAC